MVKVFGAQIGQTDTKNILDYMFPQKESRQQLNASVAFLQRLKRNGNRRACEFRNSSLRVSRLCVGECLQPFGQLLELP